MAKRSGKGRSKGAVRKHKEEERERAWVAKLAVEAGHTREGKVIRPIPPSLSRPLGDAYYDAVMAAKPPSTLVLPRPVSIPTHQEEGGGK